MAVTDSTIRVGLVGAGFVGRLHAACYALLPNVRLMAVADSRRELAQGISNETGARVYDNLADLLAGAPLDMVDVCLPTFLHEDAVLAVMERGLNCIVEKPIALDVKAGNRMADAAKRARVHFMVAHVIRFWPEYEFLKACVEDGRLGVLVALSMTRVSPRPAWGWQKWSTDPSRSGGALLDLHIHDTDFIRHLLGDPLEVDSSGCFTNGAWDYVCTQYRYPSVAVSAEGGWNFPAGYPFKMSYRATFSNGVVDYDCTRQNTLIVYTGDGGVQVPELNQPHVGSKEAGGNITTLTGYFNELKYFVDCLRQDVTPGRASAQEACASLEWVYREMMSAQRKLPSARNG